MDENGSCLAVHFPDFSSRGLLFARLIGDHDDSDKEKILLDEADLQEDIMELDS